MWIIPLIAIIPVFYFLSLAKKSPDNNNNLKGVEASGRGVKSPPPLPSSVIHSENSKSENKNFNPAPAKFREFQDDKKIKLFLYCHKVGLLQNLNIFEMLLSYIHIAQYYDIKIKDKKFIPAPEKIRDFKDNKNDFFKYNHNDFLKLPEYDKNKIYENYYNKLNSKFHNVGIYRDKNESDFILYDFIEYLNDRIDIIPDDIKTNKQINFLITDNISLAYLQYVNNFKKIKIHIETIISNNKNILDYAPDSLKKLNYKFIKFKKNEGFLESLPLAGDLIKKIEDIIPDDIKKIANELKAPLLASSILGSYAGIIVYIGQKINKDAFNSFCENLYAFAGAVVSGIFLTPLSAPLGYKLSKTQAKFVLEGKINTSDLNTEKQIITNKIKQIASDYKTDINFDSISIIDYIS